MAYICCNMIELRVKLIKELDEKARAQKEVCELLDVSRQTVSKWLSKYRVEGEAGIFPKKCGPKSGTCWNKVPEEIEDRIVDIAKKNPFDGPKEILRESGLAIDQSTVYRILKRKNIRYGVNYKHSRRKKKSYCLDTPGRELQLDVCFPFGYQRKDCEFDAIDD